VYALSSNRGRAWEGARRGKSSYFSYGR
jgi:hypothetical protein